MKTIDSARRAIAVAAMLLVTRDAKSQDCTAIAQYGLYDYELRTTSNEISESFLHWFCEQRFQSRSDAMAASSKGVVPLGDFIVNLGFDASRQTWEQFYSAVCEETQYRYHAKAVAQEHLQKINQGVLEVVNRCLGNPGLHAWLTRSANADDFTVRAKYRRPDIKGAPSRVEWSADAQISPPTTEYLAPSGKEFVTIASQGHPAALKKGVRINSDGTGIAVLFRRARAEGFKIVFSSTATMPEGQELSVPKPVSKVPTPPAYGDPIRPLYRVSKGKNPGGERCPEGLVTSSENHRLCQTAFIGYSVGSVGTSGQLGRNILVGTTPGGQPGENAGVITTQPGYYGGGTVDYGFTVAKGGLTRLYVGTSACNLNQVTTEPTYCALQDGGGTTLEIGWTYSRDSGLLIKAAGAAALQRVPDIAKQIR